MEYGFDGGRPKIHEESYVFPDATVIGDVQLGRESSVWPGASLRGDSNGIVVGERSNVQDNAVIHTTSTDGAVVGEEVTIGHGAIVHACTVQDEVLIGMGATVLTGAVIGEHSIVAAGAVVPEGTEIPPGSVVMGVPGTVAREIREGELEYIRDNAVNYAEKAQRYRKSLERL